MKTYCVLYLENDDDEPLIREPLVFVCSADDYDHAEEQCEDACPGADILWIVETDDVDAAFADYYGSAQ